MPRDTWSAKDERQYKNIKGSCLKRRKSKAICERIAAATVNKRRRKEGHVKKRHLSCACAKN